MEYSHLCKTVGRYPVTECLTRAPEFTSISRFNFQGSEPIPDEGLEIVQINQNGKRGSITATTMIALLEQLHHPNKYICVYNYKTDGARKTILPLKRSKMPNYQDPDLNGELNPHPKRFAKPKDYINTHVLQIKHVDDTSSPPKILFTLEITSDFTRFRFKLYDRLDNVVYNPEKNSFHFQPLFLTPDRVHILQEDAFNSLPMAAAARSCAHGNSKHIDETYKRSFYPYQSPRTIEKRGFEPITLGTFIQTAPGHSRIETQPKDRCDRAIGIEYSFKEGDQVKTEQLVRFSHCFPEMDEIIKEADYLEVDTSWKATPGYAYSDFHAIIKNRSVLVGFSIGLSETSENYLVGYDHIRSNLGEEAQQHLDSLPILCDMGRALRAAFGNPKNGHFHKLFYCHAHIIRAIGANSICGSLARRLLNASVFEEALERERHIVRLVYEFLLSRKIIEPCEILRCMIENETYNGFLDTESWAMYARLPHSMGSCSNHTESFHSHVNANFKKLPKKTLVEGVEAIVNMALLHWKTVSEESIPRCVQDMVHKLQHSEDLAFEEDFDTLVSALLEPSMQIDTILEKEIDELDDCGPVEELDDAPSPGPCNCAMEWRNYMIMGVHNLCPHRIKDVDLDHLEIPKIPYTRSSTAVHQATRVPATSANGSKEEEREDKSEEVVLQFVRQLPRFSFDPGATNLTKRAYQIVREVSSLNKGRFKGKCSALFSLLVSHFDLRRGSDDQDFLNTVADMYKTAFDLATCADADFAARLAILRQAEGQMKTRAMVVDQNTQTAVQLYGGLTAIAHKPVQNMISTSEDAYVCSKEDLEEKMPRPSLDCFI